MLPNWYHKKSRFPFIVGVTNSKKRPQQDMCQDRVNQLGQSILSSPSLAKGGPVWFLCCISLDSKRLTRGLQGQCKVILGSLTACHLSKLIAQFIAVKQDGATLFSRCLDRASIHAWPCGPHCRCIHSTKGRSTVHNHVHSLLD